MKDLLCPYCDHEMDVCHDDGFGYAEDKAHEMDCEECKKTFVFHTSISFNYNTSAADCLNGSPHRFREWRRLWENDAGETIEDRRCQDCDHKEQRKTLAQGSI